MLGQRQQDTEQYAQDSKGYWDEQQYWNQAVYAEQHRESSTTTQMTAAIQSQMQEQ